MSSSLSGNKTPRPHLSSWASPLPLPWPCSLTGIKAWLHTLGSQLQGVFGRSGHLLVGPVSTGGSSPVMSDAGGCPPRTQKCKLAPSSPAAQGKTDANLDLPKPFPVQGSSNLVPNHLSTCWPHTQVQSLPLTEVPHLRVHNQSLGEETEALISHFPTFFFFLIFLAMQQGCGILVPRPGTEHTPFALEAQILNHWTAREVPSLAILSHTEGQRGNSGPLPTTHLVPFLLPEKKFSASNGSENHPSCCCHPQPGDPETY